MRVFCLEEGLCIIVIVSYAKDFSFILHKYLFIYFVSSIVLINIVLRMVNSVAIFLIR